MYSLAEKQDSLDKNTRQVLSRCRNAINSDYPNARIILYGSHAVGRAQPDSDVDLLILLDEEVPAGKKRYIHDTLYDIALLEDVVISAIIISCEKWDSPISKATPLYQNIQNEGIKVA
ncbi:MAG: nucleotidyltransferase domain-containing protein [Phycisphaerae bacterium]|jgi:predicted nucleotidyltransferase